MRDKTHAEQIERWACYVKDNPDWKKKLKPFLDAQIIIARRCYAKIRKLPNGEDKIRRLREIRQK